MSDKIVNEVIEQYNEVIEQYRERSIQGYIKYNKTMERDDLSVMQWLNHLQEELMDATLYIQKLKHEIKGLPRKD
jgi:iron uptake system EfeUOB component EfeO/EfeM